MTSPEIPETTELFRELGLSSSKFIHPHAIATCAFCPFSQELKQCSCCAHASHSTTLRNLC
ncbi:unnamed protein product, partial [Musa acuminata subsp. burmannicoides]